MKNGKFTLQDLAQRLMSDRKEIDDLRSRNEALTFMCKRFMTAHQDTYVSAMADDRSRTVYDEIYDEGRALGLEAKC